ncbi:GerAB/ArcD/ProY family transporter [Crassaminicella thermophila]|uniref:GerAB/ArcD/ProY family transporter n=1 Tax=Crassaminicella thermophila TaxID=2599308 RepID=A0A5C0SBI1_CRATE|nr:GerAB/ArcD/ProY family transporter [Crassaminicella thermophila]QEK11521.1 GerAB/ArcD/ProY family transporter [Crassaminicella thermophila]
MKPKISIYQFFIIMTIFPYGSAVLFFLVPETKHDAWIAMALYSLGGIILQLLYTILYYKYPEDTLVTYLPKIYGKVLGNILGIIYIGYFAYIGARVLRDFLELIKITGLEYTPMLAIGVFFTIIVIYAVYNGIENISNTAQSFFIIIIFMPVFVWMLIILSGDIFRINNLKPILQNGIMEVVKKGWPLITFPYGETIVFTMIYPFVLERNKIRKTAILSIFFEGIILSFNTILLISTLGVEEASRSICPLFQVVQRINIRETITRLDVIFVLILVIGGFYKISIFMYASVLGVLQMTKIKSVKFLSYVFGILILYLSQIMAENYIEHLEIGLDLVVKYVHVPLQIIIPVLTLIIMYIRQFITN